MLRLLTWQGFYSGVHWLRQEMFKTTVRSSISVSRDEHGRVERVFPSISRAAHTNWIFHWLASNDFLPAAASSSVCGGVGKKEPKKRQEKLRPNGGVGRERRGKTFSMLFPPRDEAKTQMPERLCARKGKENGWGWGLLSKRRLSLPGMARRGCETLRSPVTWRWPERKMRFATMKNAYRWHWDLRDGIYHYDNLCFVYAPANMSCESNYIHLLASPSPFYLVS